jgi:PA14 domain
VKTQSFTAGTHTFTANADDGVRVYLDGTVVIDQWKDLSATTYTVSRTVTAGNHEVKVEYYEHGGDAVAKLAISP